MATSPAPDQTVAAALAEASYKIRNAPIRRFPFPHIYIAGLFPEPFYHMLQGSIPSREQFMRMQNSKHGNHEIEDKRFFLSMCDGNFRGLPGSLGDFWAEMWRVMKSPGFQADIMAAFERYCDPVRRRIGKIQHECLVVSDRNSFEIRPHTDTPQKLFSLLFYLPEDNTLEQCGTRIYRPVNMQKRYNRVDFYDFSEFQEVYRAPFLPNSLFGFVRTHNSFHGVPRVDTGGHTRNLMIYEVMAFNPLRAR